MSRATKPDAAELPKLADCERGDVVAFPTLRSSDQYEVLKFIGHKAEIRNTRTGWEQGVPASVPCRVMKDALEREEREKHE